MPILIKPEHQDVWKNHFYERLESYARCAEAVADRMFPETSLDGEQAKVIHDITSDLMWQADEHIRNEYKEDYPERDRSTLMNEDEVEELVVKIVNEKIGE